MLDIDFIRKNSDLVKEVIKNKLLTVDIDLLLELDTKRRNMETEVGALRQQRNELTKNISGKPSETDIAAGKELKEKIATLEESLNSVTSEYKALLNRVPNIPTADTPIGASEDDNKVLRTVGTKPEFTFTPKEHWQLGEELGLIDNAKAAEIAGSRFTYLMGDLAQLQFAIIQFTLSVLTNQTILEEIAGKAGVTVSPKPFIPVIPPTMIKPAVFEKMARLEPKEERYYIPSDDVFLIGSAEHTLGPLHMNETIPQENLPIRYVGISPAYRREAGSHGKDVRGILRVHQFDKIEMESFSTPESSIDEQTFIVAIQEHLMQALELPYQVVLKCTADMGAPDARAIDIETWMPGQNRYRETHTSDLMTNYQARRLNTKIKKADGTTAYAHMNDATAFAIGRILIAIMENYQRENGTIAVPKALQPYLSFDVIKGG